MASIAGACQSVKREVKRFKSWRVTCAMGGSTPYIYIHITYYTYINLIHMYILGDKVIPPLLGNPWGLGAL